tara:strand:- start:54 stop:710 length:657 start_codon:yes stop_codon:yes gene_type:complete
MKTFNQFQQDIQEKAGIPKTIFKLSKRLFSGGKKFLGKKTIPGTKINLPLGMSRGEAGLLQIGASGTFGKTIIDRIKKKKEFDNMMKFNYQEETKVLFGKPKSHREKVTKKLNKFSATFDSNKSPKFGFKIFGQEFPPKNIEVKRSLTPKTAIDRALEKYKKEQNKVQEEAPTNNVGDGQIAGTVEAGDDPPVKKKKKKGKKKTYAYGGRGSRKMWMK